MYFLDSDVCISLLRGRLPLARQLMCQSDPRLFGIPAVVEAELRTGARKSVRAQENQLLLERLLDPFARIPFDADCAVAYGRIRAQLEAEGRVIGPNDLLVAATAVARGARWSRATSASSSTSPGLTWSHGTRASCPTEGGSRRCGWARVPRAASRRSRRRGGASRDRASAPLGLRKVLC